MSKKKLAMLSYPIVLGEREFIFKLDVRIEKIHLNNLIFRDDVKGLGTGMFDIDCSLRSKGER